MATTTWRGTDRISWLQLVLATAMWGGMFAVGKHLGRELAPLAATVIRYGLASLLLVPLALPERSTVRRADLGRLFAIGLLSSVAFNGLILWGLRYAPAGDGVLISATVPVLMALVGWQWHGRTPGRRAWAFLALGVLGLGVMLTANLQATGARSRPLGDALLLAAAVVWVAYLTLQQTVADRYSPRLLTAVTALVGTVTALPLAVAEGGLGAVARLSWGAWLDLGYFALFGTVAAFLLWNRGLRRLGADRAAAVMNLIPVWGLCIAVGILGEPLGRLQLLGIGLMLTGIWGHHAVASPGPLRPTRTAEVAPTSSPGADLPVCGAHA